MTPGSFCPVSITVMNPILEYTQSGEGDPLLILHGLFGSGRNWQSLSKQFAEHFCVFTVDLRNHGNSFHHQIMDYQSMAQDICHLLEHLGLSRTRIIGHSMGGKVSMLVALQHPHLISKLVVADIAPVNYRHSHSNLIEPILAVDLAQISSRGQVDKALAGDISDPMLRGFLMQNLARSNDGWYWKVNWRAIQQQMDKLIEFPFEGDGSRLDTPALFVRGDRSDYVDEQGIAAIEGFFGNARVETLENAGHWLHAEQPQKFFDLVSDFLR